MHFISPAWRLSFILAIVSLNCLLATAAERSALTAALESIRADDLQAHVNVLADDTFEGREAGSRGGRAASGYLRKQFEKYGLHGAGADGGYYQPFDAGYRNLLGMLPGSDPELKKQVIVVGAHYDHVGYGSWNNSNGPTGYIHNGADDNASGTAGLLEVIEALTRLPTAPKRSILFALWDGEEKGLLGSKHWVAEPTVPLRQVPIMINMDMIGRLRNKRLEVIGTRTSPGLRRLVSQRNQQIGLELAFPWSLKDNSDHYSFYERDIPILLLHTGLHDDYHRPSDDAHKVNAQGMQEVVRLLLGVIDELSERSQLAPFRAASRNESGGDRRQFERPLRSPPPRLGVWWEQIKQPKPGLRLTRVVSGSPAEQGGLKVGDVIEKFAGHRIDNETQFRTAVLQASGDTQVLVKRAGQEKPVPFTVRIPGKPVRLGIAWRENTAEPGVVTLVQVIPGSAAARAGLRLHDRIYQINGRRFNNSNEFLQLATTLPSPLPMLLERHGRIKQVTLDVPPIPETKSNPPAAAKK